MLSHTLGMYINDYCKVCFTEPSWNNVLKGKQSFIIYSSPIFMLCVVLVNVLFVNSQHYVMLFFFICCWTYHTIISQSKYWQVPARLLSFARKKIVRVTESFLVNLANGWLSAISHTYIVKCPILTWVLLVRYNYT